MDIDELTCEPGYLEVMPKRGVYLKGGAGSTSTTQNQMMPWSQYVPGSVAAAEDWLIPRLQSKYDVGLTPEETQYYTGQTLSNIASQAGGAKKSLGETLARSGTLPSSGAATEAYSNLERGQVQAEAQGLSNIIGQDIAQKQTNVENLMKAMAIPGSPVVMGSTTTQRQMGGS